MSTTDFCQYDMNVWDRGGYRTEYAPGSEQWVLQIYSTRHADGLFISGDWLEGDEYELVLTPDEAKRLTLGWSPDLGGDYASDSDFFLDPYTFTHTYTDIPERVRTFLKAFGGE